MPPQPQYAQLPKFQYQHFDPLKIVYSDHPIVPPPRPNMGYSDENADADDPPKNGNAPANPPVDTELVEPPMEIVDLGDMITIVDGRSTLHLRR
jgi:hypothetical protein